MSDPTPQGGHGAASRKPTPFPHTSDMLQGLLAQNAEREITLSELTAGLKNRVLGFIIVLFAVPCILPMPPGIPFACGLVLMTCGLHLLVGREALWLPGFLAERTIARSVLEKIATTAVPVARRLERLCRPRWAWLTSRVGRACIGVLVILLSTILLLPIPLLGNMPPGLAISILALGLIERDGVVILIGVLASVGAVVLTSAMAWAAIRGLGWLL